MVAGPDLKQNLSKEQREPHSITYKQLMVCRPFQPKSHSIGSLPLSVKHAVLIGAETCGT
jgi:hypothetical protein